ncbi:hypothetical protein F1D05_33535 [Kribbella qitaiheensis]|uniref:Uncharacterized protein n=1 Tax=Kribbella qitaiheensis TaxID=1544730 RepID=A0A7G6X6S4_9ACTN|nr:hypothetical protein [Kribbella qitaiheensis]QNE21939.1 hypothetical protein F1D05_33535 [Kribbella qitaiheensis]
MRVRSKRMVPAVAAVGAVLLTIAAAAPSGATAASHRTEGHVTGDAWVSFSVDPGNPLRRFIFDVHGNPYKIVDGKVYFGAAHGTVRFDHPTPDGHGGTTHNWGSIEVDYLMTAGPVAVISGKSNGDLGTPKGKRLSLTVYDDPRGDRYDRLGFSWGVIDSTCVPMGLGPAPFTTYKSGPGYKVRAAELPVVPEGTTPPDLGDPCPPE